MKYVTAAIALVLLAGTFHILFIMFDYVYYNSTDGAFTQLEKTMNESLGPRFEGIAYNQSTMFREGFGIGRFVCIGLCLVCFALEAIDRSRGYSQQ